MDPILAQKRRVRGMILTAGVAAITIVGTIVGAGMKNDEEVKEARAVLQKPVEQRPIDEEAISALESRRAGLLLARQQWERKADALQARIEQNKLRVIKEDFGKDKSADAGSEASGK